jgi:hypothetical protein
MRLATDTAEALASTADRRPPTADRPKPDPYCPCPLPVAPLPADPYNGLETARRGMPWRFSIAQATHGWTAFSPLLKALRRKEKMDGPAAFPWPYNKETDAKCPS